MSDGPQSAGRDSAIPATYRRAPRTERFIATGVGIGAVVALILGLVLPAGSAGGRGVAGLLVALAGALAGGLITGSQAVYYEYSSGRSADRQRATIIDHWDGEALPVPDATAASQPEDEQDGDADAAR